MCTTNNDGAKCPLLHGGSNYGQTRRRVHTETVHLKSGENLWLSLVDQPGGSLIKLVLTKGTAEIDGHPLPLDKPREFNCYSDYFIQTWKGCIIKIESVITKIENLKVRIKSSTIFHQLLTAEFSTATRVLVVDRNHNAALNVANYAYRRQTEPSAQHLMINLDTKGNMGVCCLYYITATVPPHHPVDFLPEYKHMFWSIEEATGAMAELSSRASRVTVYINTDRYTDDEVVNIVERMDIKQVITTSDRRFVSLSRKLTCGVSKLAPVTSDTPNDCDVVYKNIFLQRYRVFHYPAHTKLSLTKFVKTTHKDVLSAGSSTKHYVSLEGSEKNGKVFAVVSELEKDKLVTFWGFAIIDLYGRCHTVIPYLEACRLTFVYVMDF